MCQPTFTRDTVSVNLEATSTGTAEAAYCVITQTEVTFTGVSHDTLVHIYNKYSIDEQPKITYIRLCVRVCLGIFVCMYVYMDVWMYTCMYVRITYVRTYVRTYVCMYVSM